MRRYLKPTDPASCALTIVEVKVKIGDTESVKTSSHVTFRTRFSDETVLTTRNMSLKSLLDRPPYSIIQECRRVASLAELKRRHDARAAQMGPALPPASGPKAVFDEKQREHRRFAEFQVKRETYRLLPDGGAYEVTDKARLRASGITTIRSPGAYLGRKQSFRVSRSRARCFRCGFRQRS